MNRSPRPNSPPAHERDGCLEACRRLRTMIEMLVAHDDDAYREVGAHARHCLEHLGALLRGLDLGRVDYDGRRRDRTMERSAAHALEALDGIERRLVELELDRIDGVIDVLQVAAPDAPSSAIPSSVRRELAFLSSHTIHHLALMAAIAGRRGIVVPESLLLAFSTAAHRQAASG